MEVVNNYATREVIAPEIKWILKLASEDLQGFRQVTYRRLHPKVGRNEKCPCGSSKKFKLCCGKKHAKD